MFIQFRRPRSERRMRRVIIGTACAGSILALSWAAFSDSLPPDASYRPLPTQPFSVVRAADEVQKPAVMRRQAELLPAPYDLSHPPIPAILMSVKRKALPAGAPRKRPQGLPC